MSEPLPEVSLGSHCSAIYNSTLYTFSEDAFQSLSLSQGAEWDLLPSGISVSGAQCVTSQEALYIVGGTTSNTSTTPDTGFMGLQKFTFTTQVWETLSLPTAVTFNLTNHGATFLESSQQIIVIAGTTWPDTSTASANTYLIGISAPYDITSVPASTAPLLAPMVLPWGSNGALIVGGDTSNTALKVYTTDGGWDDLNATLASGLPARGKAGASLMDGDDGSRMLYTFDMTTVPTTVEQVEVMSVYVSKRDTAAASSASSSSELTLSNWPTYNSSLAPTTTRSDTSLAYDSGLVVISGGDDQDPLVFFNGRTNSWENATDVLSASVSTASIESQGEESSTQTMSNTRSRTSTSSPTSTAAISSGVSSAANPDATATDSSSVAESSSSASAEAVASSSSKLSTHKVLGIVLGSVLGICLFLGIILFLLRRRHRKLTEQTNKRMSFQDRGASYIEEPGAPSWLMSEKGYAPSSVYSPTTPDGPVVRAVGGVGVVVTSGSTTNLAPGDRNAPTNVETRGSNSGWSRYFSGTSATNLVGSLPPAARTYDDARSSAYTDASVNEPVYTNPYIQNAGPGVFAGGVGFATSGSLDATMLQRSPSKGLVLQDPAVGRNRPVSAGTISSVGASSYSSGIPESLDEKALWTPVGGLNVPLDGKNRIPSSVYPDSPMTVFPSGIMDSARDSRRDTRDTAEIATEASENNLSWLVLSQT
ncbi:hypothetical protein RUND412_002049 [Rhizina undulata]